MAKLALFLVSVALSGMAAQAVRDLRQYDYGYGTASPVPTTTTATPTPTPTTATSTPATVPAASTPTTNTAPAPAPAPAADFTSVEDWATKKNFTALLEVANALELTTAIGPDFNGTVFAPTNAAFEALFKALGATPEELIAGAPEEAAETLKLHILPQHVPGSNLVLGKQWATLADGYNVRVTAVSPNITVTAGGSSAEVLKTDIKAGNAVVHIIDTVLTPGAKGPAYAPAHAPAHAPAQA